MHDPDNIIINEKLELIIDRLSKMDEKIGLFVNPDTIKKEDYLDNQDLCMLLGVTKKTLYRYRRKAELRSRLAYPILVRFEKWLVAEYPKVQKTSPIAKAIKYVYQRFDKLSRYHLDGRYRPDNNLAYPKVLITWLRTPSVLLL